MRVVFIGTGEIGVPTLRWLLETKDHELVGVVTQPDKPVGRSQRLTSPPIKEALAGSTLPILQPVRLKRDEAAVAAIRSLTPDLIIVVAYGQILPRAVLEIPSVACLNLHASLLPHHRGAAPIQAALMSGDPQTGITVMFMDEGLDTGDILLQKRIAIGEDETGGTLHDRLGALAPTALRDALTEFKSGKVPRVPQNPLQATYAPKLEREHGLLDIRESTIVNERKIRAFDPWPGSYLVLRDGSALVRKLKVFGAVVADRPFMRPGEISVANDSVIIGVKDGALQLRDVQLEGKTRMSAAEFARGHSWLKTAIVAPAT
ncbi:MAG: methionyl-tRNA formyltransferase [Verrucomicrobiota bacterium]|nr:methionyl-tRNA formyltransferase [Verrucomicrobiota bacterium]